MEQPLSIDPEYIWRLKRIDSINTAIVKYAIAGELWPDDWIEELYTHKEWIKIYNRYAPTTSKT